MLVQFMCFQALRARVYPSIYIFLYSPYNHELIKVANTFFFVFNSSSIPERTLTIYTFVVYFPCGVLCSGCLNRVYTLPGSCIICTRIIYLHSQSTAAASPLCCVLRRPIGLCGCVVISLIEQTKVNRENTHRQYPQINGFYAQEESPRFT